MCMIKSIRLFVSIFSWFKLVFMLYIFGAGCFLANSSDMQSAYGKEFVSYGVGLIFLAMLSMAMIYPFRYAVNRHNRFILALVFVIETLVFGNLLGVGSTMLAYTTPLFEKSLQLDCLRYQPVKYTQDQCEAFYNSDRTAGFRLFWNSYFSRRANKYDNQVLATIEKSSCCGFFQPFRCIENTSKFPPKFNPQYVSGKLLKQRVTCSDHAGYYPAQDDCVNYIDFAAGIVGGCYYDLGTGYCLKAGLLSNSAGCASATEDYVAALITPHALLVMGLAAMNFMYMFLACVMWWKRKETDVFPTYVDDDKKIVSPFPPLSLPPSSIQSLISAGF